MPQENVEIINRAYELMNALGRTDDDTVATALIELSTRRSRWCKWPTSQAPRGPSAELMG